MHENFFHKLKVYYEDTDSGGVVYYANYLKFLERARTEALFSIGYSNKKIKDDSYIIVHCSAGVGRTGTYMTLARILHEYEGLKSSDQHVSFCDRLQTFIFQVDCLVCK